MYEYIYKEIFEEKITVLDKLNIAVGKENIQYPGYFICCEREGEEREREREFFLYFINNESFHITHIPTTYTPQVFQS